MAQIPENPTSSDVIDRSYLLQELRDVQYTALARRPVNWDIVDKLGTLILELEIERVRKRNARNQENAPPQRSAA